MKTRFRLEEYTALGDFILPSFVRDQAAIVAVFPRMDSGFLSTFTAKLAFVKQLESSLTKTEQQKSVTQTLYIDAAALNAELSVLHIFMVNAGFNTQALSTLKKDLRDRNIEGAILKLESLKQFVTANQAALETEGMSNSFVDVLTNYKDSLEAKNSLQNQYMNDLRELTEANHKHYEELYTLIYKIAAAGKLVFKNSVIRDEYAIVKVLRRMRSAKQKREDTPDAA